MQQLSVLQVLGATYMCLSAHSPQQPKPSKLLVSQGMSGIWKQTWK